MLAEKMRAKNVKLTVLMARLSAVDGNRDGIIHSGDLEEVLIDYLGADGISRREILHLSRLLAPLNGRDDGAIEFQRLSDLLSAEGLELDKRDEYLAANPDEDEEKWYDAEDYAMQRARFQRGSVGDWLQNAACPAEVKNFRRLIQCLEEYERISGLKCVPKDNGFVIPMGPDLKANLSFFMTG